MPFDFGKMNETPLKPAQNPTMDHAPPYQPMLKESIDRFLAEYSNGVTDFSDFSSIFSRLLQNVPDPSLQFVWFYAALEFHMNKLAVQREPLTRASTAKDLFQLLVSCSDYCGSLKRIGILAPVVYELYHLALQEKHLKSEVQSLLEGLISYCSIFCGKELRGENNGPTSLDPSFLDVIPVWMVDLSGAGDYLKGFFPIVSDQFRKGIEVRCEIGFLAGIVMCEALLLKLCLDFEPGIVKAEQKKKLCDSAIQIITGFRNSYFLDTLFRTMLEPVLPVIPLLGSENEVLLKEVLYTAVMTVEYSSFIIPQTGITLYANTLKDLSVTWLFVADLAIQSAREQGDWEKAISYLNAFSRSCMPLQLINWVAGQSEMGRKISKPNVPTPIALIKWLLAVEDQGLAVFDGDTAKLRAKAKFWTSRTEHVLPEIRQSDNNLDSDLLADSIYGGTNEDKVDGDIEMVDSTDTMFLAAENRRSTGSTDGTRKRKEGIEDETKTRVKFMRCQFHGNSMRENSVVFGQQ
ncbi:hypothetical protein L6164_024517 [Bauhinia variegata]|uniref:Uncharacterized protein n=1 Tax=Bauhinia variegata TaxID=167791 RepID=A0ACB9LYZ1_BAUVA|nr:hypothetical protein L6164_024517 [Bauhinia variegata]